MSIIIETEQDVMELEENIIYGLVEPQEIVTKLQLSEELTSTVLEMGFTLTDGESSSNNILEEDSVTQKEEEVVETQEIKTDLTAVEKGTEINEFAEEDIKEEIQEVEEKSVDDRNLESIKKGIDFTEREDRESKREEFLNKDKEIEAEEESQVVKDLYKKQKEKKEKKESSGLFGKLFKRKKFEPEEIELRTGSIDEENTKEVSAVESIKKYIIANKLMSKKDIETVDRYIEQNSAYSKKLFFLDTACSLNLLDEETCTKILSINKSMDVISTKTVMKNWERILRINSKIFRNKSVQDYFVLDVIGEDVVVVTDPEYSKPNTSFYDIEIEYTGFNLTRCNMLDSSFAQTISKLNKDLVRAKIS